MLLPGPPSAKHCAFQPSDFVVCLDRAFSSLSLASSQRSNRRYIRDFAGQLDGAVLVKYMPFTTQAAMKKAIVSGACTRSVKQMYVRNAAVPNDVIIKRYLRVRIDPPYHEAAQKLAVALIRGKSASAESYTGAAAHQFNLSRLAKANALPGYSPELGAKAYHSVPFVHTQRPQRTG